jgi:hypothetical protein
MVQQTILATTTTFTLPLIPKEDTREDSLSCLETLSPSRANLNSIVEGDCPNLNSKLIESQHHHYHCHLDQHDINGCLQLG